MFIRVATLHWTHNTSRYVNLKFHTIRTRSIRSQSSPYKPTFYYHLGYNSFGENQSFAITESIEISMFFKWRKFSTRSPVRFRKHTSVNSGTCCVAIKAHKFAICVIMRSDRGSGESLSTQIAVMKKLLNYIREDVARNGRTRKHPRNFALILKYLYYT